MARLFPSSIKSQRLSEAVAEGVWAHPTRPLPIHPRPLHPRRPPLLRPPLPLRAGPQVRPAEPRHVPRLLSRERPGEGDQVPIGSGWTATAGGSILTPPSYSQARAQSGDMSGTTAARQLLSQSTISKPVMT